MPKDNGIFYGVAALAVLWWLNQKKGVAAGAVFASDDPTDATGFPPQIGANDPAPLVILVDGEGNPVGTEGDAIPSGEGFFIPTIEPIGPVVVKPSTRLRPASEWVEGGEQIEKITRGDFTYVDLEGEAVFAPIFVPAPSALILDPGSNYESVGAYEPIQPRPAPGDDTFFYVEPPLEGPKDYTLFGYEPFYTSAEDDPGFYYEPPSNDFGGGGIDYDSELGLSQGTDDSGIFDGGGDEVSFSEDPSTTGATSISEPDYSSEGVGEIDEPEFSFGDDGGDF